VESVANDLLSALEIVARLREIDEASAASRPAPGKWSKKEILGHLIDSAANNHQRFVRLQLTPRIDLPGYDGDDWVRLQQYQDRPWREIIELWRAYNMQLAALIRDVNPAALQNVWHTPDSKDLTLSLLSETMSYTCATI
jgi:hypothetical protein